MSKKNEIQKRAKARDFVNHWQQQDGKEESQAHSFWLEFFELLGIDNPSRKLDFEKRIRQRKIDIYYEDHRVLIENKSRKCSLTEKRDNKQYGEESPFDQALWYYNNMGAMNKPYWIVLCNFDEFHIYDMRESTPYEGECRKIKLQDLPNKLNAFSFLLDEKQSATFEEKDISVKAAELVGKLYDSLKGQYPNIETDRNSQRELNILIVRLVFLLYAEDAGLFAEHLAFHNYMTGFSPEEFHNRLQELFEVLDTPEDQRNPYLTAKLQKFCYVNGGLFSRRINIPPFTRPAIYTLLVEASRGFNWKNINPTIFGASFESTLNPVTRRSGGMHYTSKENIHKVIDPLFLDDLKEELSQISAIKTLKTRNLKLTQFKDKLSELVFFDPACGSGNFLTETYLALRSLENQVIEMLVGYDNKLLFSGSSQEDTIQVHVSQFYGLEINDFAVDVAKTALWIAEQQMMEETQQLLPDYDFEFLPLKSNNNIMLGNALKLQWEEFVSKDRVNYIIGNPPFLGYSNQSAEQKKDILSVYTDSNGVPYPNAGKNDYVSAWFFKAAAMMENTNIRTALVATNSITQGEQVKAVWKPLYDRFGIHIDFAHRTFRWDNEAASKGKAHVHCVIVGFSSAEPDKAKSILFDGNRVIETKVINPYLDTLPVFFIEKRKKPLGDVPLMRTGNRPADGGALIIKAEEYDEFVRREPQAKKYIKKLLGSEEFINNKPRYCLWLAGEKLSEWRAMPEVTKRVEACRQARLASPDPGRQKLAEKPHLFRETNNPDCCIVVPEVSSEKRKYVPIGFMDKQTILTNLVFIIPEGTLYHFGVLNSSLHVAWMRAVAGRLKSDYRYSQDLVYNTFPWPNLTPAQKTRVMETSQGILNARKACFEADPNASFADLYDDKFMPPALRQAHVANDIAVMQAYGFNESLTEPECVTKLVEMYKSIVAKLDKK